MAAHDLAKIHVSEIAIVVDNCVETVEIAKLADNFELFFVKRIANQIALNGERIFHETRGMEGADGLVMGDARCDDLAAAGPASHEMRFDQAGSDTQIRLDETAVEFSRRSPRRGKSEIDMISVIARIMVLNSDPLHDPRIADQFRSSSPRFGRCRPVATRMVMLSSAMPEATRVSIIGRKKRWLGTGRVMSQMSTQALLRPPGEGGERSRIDRVRQRLSNGRCRIGDFLKLALLDHGDFRVPGHAQIKLSAAVKKGDRFRTDTWRSHYRRLGSIRSASGDGPRAKAALSVPFCRWVSQSIAPNIDWTCDVDCQFQAQWRKASVTWLAFPASPPAFKAWAHGRDRARMPRPG